ncbi:hypothetical protein AJ80_02184 [Polytolypa hystricis UAMH7299]|uniref:Saccharopine dehydrogenase NADP binding domain-containing protein n=1 Tax=Polytolypa hystricis (strain UAMH7299) TaxID=1447883 RepID=A0A2B7YI39_POLH7|nr:hypothetical protein AJ80_02184 [Polytolypa hystricis UAMH7299]
MTSTRHFDIVLLGATGYTGKLCAEHIARHHPTNLKWGIAGRSGKDLKAVADELHKINPDRKEPEIEEVQLNKKEEMGHLARRTRVLINCVGPYHLYSTPVVEACAEQGTHYLDVTGEFPWIKEMINKYEEKAKSTGAIMIPATGFESAPSDLLTWALVDMIKTKYGVQTKEVTNVLYKLKTSGASGGTLSSIISTFEKTSLSDLLTGENPYLLAASPPNPTALASSRASLAQRLFGVRTVPDIGTVTTTPAAICDVVVVQRSRSLMPDLYGPDFQFREFGKVPNMLMGVLLHLALVIGAVALTFSPVRSLLERFVYGPGEGPTKESAVGCHVEYRAIATAEHKQPAGKSIRVMGTYKHDGAPYPMTAIVISEAAMVLLKSRRISKESHAGFMTPAILGQEFVDRLEKVGCFIETKVLEE